MFLSITAIGTSSCPRLGQELVPIKQKAAKLATFNGIMFLSPTIYVLESIPQVFSKSYFSVKLPVGVKKLKSINWLAAVLSLLSYRFPLVEH